MKLSRAILLAAFGIILAWSAPINVAACECMHAPEALDALADSNAVFRGTVTEVRDPQPSLRLQSSFPFVVYDIPPYAALTVTIAVSQTWRGPMYRKITLTTGRFYSGCGVPFQNGHEYLVYAYYNGIGELITHRCSRTAVIDHAYADLALFGPGDLPNAEAPSTGQPTAWAVSCLFGLILFAGGGVLLLRRLR